MTPFTARSRRPDDRPDDRQGAPPVKLADYGRYRDAQAAVDQLSDQGFPMIDVSIVWSGLRRVEYVTGRRTVATAARDGAMAGAWFGLIIGLLFTAFADIDGALVAVLAVYALTGGVTVAAYQAFAHWARRGTRDFSTIGTLDAERFEVWVEPGSLARAQTILGLASTRAGDPMPSDVGVAPEP